MSRLGWHPGFVDWGADEDSSEANSDTPKNDDSHDCVDGIAEELAGKESLVLEENGKLGEGGAERVKESASVLDLEEDDQIAGSDGSDVSSKAMLNDLKELLGIMAVIKDWGRRTDAASNVDGKLEDLMNIRS